MSSDIETLWRTTIEKNPRAWMAHNNLGALLLKRGKVDEAIVHFQSTLEIKPNEVGAEVNLGNALLRKGQPQEAIAHYQKALELNPEDIQARANLAWALATTEQTPILKAIFVKLAEQANQLTGGANPTVLHILAAAYARKGVPYRSAK